jgi:hypothetical protein
MKLKSNEMIERTVCTVLKKLYVIILPVQTCAV